jgi:hypothetical protein
MQPVHYLPKWTKRFVIEGGGRDPLGLSRVAFTLTDYLLTGIITTTDRARYYSFYSWSLWHIAQEEKPENYNDFVSAMRRREAAMAMATLASNPLLSPVGVKVVSSQLNNGKQTGEYDCNFKVLPSNPLGGFGQYYGSSIYHLKLSHRDENYISEIAAGDGKELAQAFHETIKNTKYIKEQKYLIDIISEQDIKELQKKFSLDSLGESFARKEREKLIEILFSLNENYTDEKSIFRRQTLTILLHLISEYQKNGNAAQTDNARTLDEYLLFAIYYEALWIYAEDTEEVKPFKKLKNYDHCYALWQQFCLHQFIGQALEYLLYAVLEAVGAEITGKSLTEAIEIIMQPDFFTILEEETGAGCYTPQKFLLGLGIKKVPDQSFSADYQKNTMPDHPQSEAKILGLEEKTAPESAVKSLLLLGTLYGKWRGMYQNNVMRLVEHHAGQEVWAKSVLTCLDDWLNPDTTWKECLSNLIEEFILNQHDRIMYEKRRLDSSWLHRADGKIIRDQDYRPNWRASRFFNAVRIMTDLQLVETNEEKKVMTAPEGEKLLKRIIN